MTKKAVKNGKILSTTPSPTSKGYIAKLINDQNIRLLRNNVSGSVTALVMMANGLQKKNWSGLFIFFHQQKSEHPKQGVKSTEEKRAGKSGYTRNHWTGSGVS